MISQGGMGSFSEYLNYWALSDLSAEDSGVAGGVKKGAFRVGGNDEYFKVTPDPLIPNKYSIELKAGNIELTSDVNGDSAMDFQNGTYVYNDKRDSRLKLSPSGIVAEKLITTAVQSPSGNPYANGWYVYLDGKWERTTDRTVVQGRTYYIGNWQQMAKVITDDKGNMILTNSDDTPPFGYQVENADIYHLEDARHPEYEEVESGTPTNPQSLVFNGAVEDSGNYAPIIDTTSSSKCFNGTVVKNISNWTGRVAFFTKSNAVIVSGNGIKTDGTVITNVTDELVGFNDAMRETSTIDSTKTVGSYLGLNATQIERGIFY
jgi:hypothetical protein